MSRQNNDTRHPAGVVKLESSTPVQSRRQAIAIIEQHYPADHPAPIWQIPGERLLMQAICQHWRDLPEPVLRHYASLCLEEAEKQRQQHFLNEQRSHE